MMQFCIDCSWYYLEAIITQLGYSKMVEELIT